MVGFRFQSTQDTKNNEWLTLSTSYPFQSNPPQANHSCVVINMKESYLIVLLTEKEKYLSDEELTHTIIRSHLWKYLHRKNILVLFYLQAVASCLLCSSYPFPKTNFQNFSRTQIDFSRTLKFTLTLAKLLVGIFGSGFLL